VAAVNGQQRNSDKQPVVMAMHLLGGLRLVAQSGQGAPVTDSAAHASASNPATAPNAAGRQIGGAEGLESRHHVRALLALAGSSSQGVSRDEVVDLLWPNLGAAQGRNRLYHTVHLARKALSALAWDDEWVMVRHSHVQIDERVWCDVRQLEAAARQGQDQNHQERRASAGDLQALLPLCSGEWMPDLDVGAVGEALRGRVRKLQATVLRRVVQRNQAQGDTPTQRALLHSLLLLEATDEWAYCELMRLELAAGRRHAVLRHFDKLSRALSAQLGLLPSVQTSALAAAASAQLQQLPNQGEALPRGSLLVGRESLIQDLVAQTAAQAGVWLLTGPSGIGKTSLAREVAHRLAPLMADGVCFVNVGDLGSSSGAALGGPARESTAAACVRVLGMAPAGGLDEKGLFESAVKQRLMLLVLDDLDVAEDAQALLNALPVGTMKARVIATCRAPFAAGSKTGHRLVPVPPLTVPALNAGLARATESASVTLFRMRCPVPLDQQAQSDWQGDAVRLVRKLDGLPLAIELAAARTASMTPGEILLHIERSLDTLTDGPVNMEGRHRSLRVSLDWSVQLLRPAAHAVYCAVSVFTGAFNRFEVLALMPAVLGTQSAVGAAGAKPFSSAVGAEQAEHVEQAEQAQLVDAALQELLAGGLLARVNDLSGDASGDAPAAGGKLLRMLHLPRAHARALALAQGQWQALVDLRLTQICRVFEAHPLHFDSPLFGAHLQEVLAVEGEALSLLEHAKTHQPQRFVLMLRTLFDSWVCQGAGTSILRYADAAIQVAQQLNSPLDELSLRVSTCYAKRTRDTSANAEVFSRSLLPLAQRVLQMQEPAPAHLRAHAQVLALRAMDGRAMCLVQTGQKEEAIQLLLAPLASLQLQTRQAGYWLLHTRIAYLTMRLRPGVTIDLDSLRPRFEGSPLWVEILRAKYEDFAGGADWAYRQTVAEDIVASARLLRSPLLTFIGIWAKGVGQFGTDDIRGGLNSLQEACELARRSGLEHLVVDALPVRALWHRYAQEFDKAEQCLRDTADVLAQRGRDALVVRVPLQAAALHSLRGQAEAARKNLAAVPSERLQTVGDEELVRWAESAALLAKLQGRTEQLTSLVETFRRFDFVMDAVPLIARFRDREFGVLPAQATPAEAQITALRIDLRTHVKEFHDTLLSGV
jgi:DNA-binding SARP family transcriptional activator